MKTQIWFELIKISFCFRSIYDEQIYLHDYPYLDKKIDPDWVVDAKSIMKSVNELVCLKETGNTVVSCTYQTFQPSSQFFFFLRNR